jgi:hypothetical protein
MPAGEIQAVLIDRAMIDSRLLGPHFVYVRQRAADTLTDGLLLIRFLFGFDGDTLINGAIGGGCTRCDAGSVETYCATLAP